MKEDDMEFHAKLSFILNSEQSASIIAMQESIEAIYSRCLRSVGPEQIIPKVIAKKDPSEEICQ